MNQFSFSSEDDRNESHCLQQEIGFEQIGDWRGNSEEKVEFDGECVEEMLSEFNMDLEDNNEIIHTFTKHAECSEVFETLTPQINSEEVKCSEDGEEEEQQEEETSPTLEFEQAITFYEEPNQETTIVGVSILEQKWQQGGKNALNEFSALCESTYNPLLQTYKETIERLKAYNQQSIGTIDMYCLFFRIKRDQQIKRLKLLKSIQKQNAELVQNKLLENVYLDQRTVVAELTLRSQQRKEDVEIFSEQLEQSINKIKIFLNKAVQIRKKKFQSLESQHQRLGRIQQELIELLNKSPTANQGWLGNSDIKSDRYLQRKYLFERETLYLSLLGEMRQKLVTLLNIIFVKEDPIIFAMLNRQMIRYKRISDTLYGQSKSSPSLAKLSPEQLDSSLSDVLQGVVPGQWNEIDDSPLTCEAIIEKVNEHLQNQIFLPVVELNQEYVQIMATALWLPKTVQNENSPPIDNRKDNNEFVGKNQEWQSTYYSLVSDRQAGNGPIQMKVNVVLTLDKYLHLQCGQQIASLKLRKLKLSRKGRRIVVSQKSRSIVSLFASSLILGELEFKTEEISLNFINAVLNSRNL